MNILEKIIANKKIEIAAKKELVSIQDLVEKEHFQRKNFSLKNSLITSSTGIIAEFKRKSPSKSWINESADEEIIIPAYSKNGGTGISILTDRVFFGGKLRDLINGRALVNTPLLRKDFIVDEFQLYESKAYGADVILLIAAAMSVEECLYLARKAKELGLEILLEIHSEEELDHVNEYIDMVGVNNRNLKTFEVSIDTSFSLADKIPNAFVKVSESGISSAQTIKSLREVGYRGFLMGENFMKTENPALALKKTIQDL